MTFSGKDLEFINYIMENSDGSERRVGDFIIRNDFGTNAYYEGEGGEVIIPSEVDGTMTLNWNDAEEHITSLTYPNTNTFEEIYVGISSPNLKELNLPEGLKRIWGEAGFGDCTALEKVYLPDSLEYLGHNAFKNSPWLEKTLEKEDGCYYLGKFLYKSEKDVVHIAVREGTIMIGEWAFKGCKSLQSVQIPDSVKTIGSQAFAGCENLENVVCPASVEVIEASAFAKCEKLKCFMAHNSKLIIADNAFASPTRDTFHVPEKVYIPNVKIEKLKPIQKMFFLLCFLQGMDSYSQEEADYYTGFVKKSKKKLLEYILEKNMIPAFKNICSLCVKKKEMEDLILKITQNGQRELTAMALEIKQNM